MLTEIKSFLIEYFSRFGSNQSEVEGNFRNKDIIIYLLSDREMSGEPDKLIVSLKKMDSNDSIWNDRVKDKTTHIEITVDQETWIGLKSTIWLYKKGDVGRHYPIYLGNRHYNLKRVEIDTRWQTLNPLIVIEDIFTNLTIEARRSS
jgi:hypothetical protein